MNKIDLIENTMKRTDLPPFRAGDTINVHVRVIEDEKERIQQFQGVVIAIKGEGSRRMFTVRKVTEGVGVERIFPLYSPRIAKIDRIREGSVRRAKLYYLRHLAAKQVRQKTS